jgi:hypothetical protein
MTSPDILQVRYEGVVCKADAVVVEGAAIQFLSIYGAPQQTKGIFSALAASRLVTIGEEFYSRPPQAMRYKGFSLGYAKSHGVIYSEDLGGSIVLWTSDEEKERRLRQALARRKIPYDPKDFGKFERILRDNENLIPLDTLAGMISGYRCEFNDDAICDHLIQTLYRKRASDAAAA